MCEKGCMCEGGCVRERLRQGGLPHAVARPPSHTLHPHFTPTHPTTHPHLHTHKHLHTHVYTRARAQIVDFSGERKANDIVDWVKKEAAKY